MYDWRGAWIEPDDHEPELRRRCACGAFLPKEPEVRTGIHVTAYENTYDGEGNITDTVILAEEKVTTEAWTCKRCGKDYDASEMYV